MPKDLVVVANWTYFSCLKGSLVPHNACEKKKHKIQVVDTFNVFLDIGSLIHITIKRPIKCRVKRGGGRGGWGWVVPSQS